MKTPVMALTVSLSVVFEVDCAELALTSARVRSKNDRVVHMAEDGYGFGLGGCPRFCIEVEIAGN